MKHSDFPHVDLKLILTKLRHPHCTKCHQTLTRRNEMMKHMHKMWKIFIPIHEHYQYYQYYSLMAFSTMGVSKFSQN